jgi:hypothetical protein
MKRKIVRLAMVAGFLAIGALGTHQLMARPPQGGGCPTGRANCVCPQYMDPVICPDGCTYYNSCAASCAGEHGCTSTGGGPIEL